MRLFRCQVCEQTAYFENTKCERCCSPLGYLPDVGLMSALEPAVAPDLLATLDQAGLLEAAGLLPAIEEVWLAHVRPGQSYRFCANAGLVLCNWMVPAEAEDTCCAACRHNRRISDITLDDNLARWRQLERAKHRLFYSLVKLQLPLRTRAESPDGLAFDFLADPPDPKEPRVMTGHANGLITIALREADDVEREKMRKSLGEPYRTLLGHFRHETGHYFWNQLVRERSHLEACRAVFGDDRIDYGEALEVYYANGASPGWQDRFISAYATMHPWEDFAETWAHYLHMIDTLEAAAAHGVELHSRNRDGSVRTVIDFDPYQVQDFDPIINSWLPLSRAANSMNRAMGQPDLYPFVLSPAVIGKLRFIHGLVQEHRARRVGSMAPAR
jgi:hypothetical protein